MKALVTGAAGFIGSHLSERLLAEGHEVVGIDCFTEYYDRSLKERNIAGLRGHPSFRLRVADLATANLHELVEGSDLVFHLAGQPGVRASWGDDFRVYLERNLWATQRLLEALRDRPIKKLVFASSSSVYGDAERYPTRESDLPQPISPYGVTKLAGERLCLAYHAGYGVPAIALRYFTVYGPRQRPDMAFPRFIAALQGGKEITVYGDGQQTRDFTFVADTVEATIRAGLCDTSGVVLNVGGGSRVPLIDVITVLGQLCSVEPRIRFADDQRGDVRNTGADPARAEEVLHYRPQTPLFEGLRRQVEYLHPASVA